MAQTRPSRLIQSVAALVVFWLSWSPSVAQDQPTAVDAHRAPDAVEIEQRQRALEEQIREFERREQDARRRADEERQRREAAEAAADAASQRAEADRKAREERERELEQVRQEADRLRNERRAEPPATAAALACGLAVQSLPLSGGRTRISIDSPCRAGEPVTLRYGQFSATHHLDAMGHLETILDLFLGLEPGLQIAAADGASAQAELRTHDIESVIKVAILWKAPVDLDLHALEYTTHRGGMGHIWSGQPSDPDTARALSARTAQSHGFLSVLESSGSGANDKVQVYTVWNNKAQQRGKIALLIDYRTRGDTPTLPYCGTGELARLPVTIVRLRFGREQRQDAVLLSAAACDRTLQPNQRFNPYLIDGLRIRNG